MIERSHLGEFQLQQKCHAGWPDESPGNIREATKPGLRVGGKFSTGKHDRITAQTQQVVRMLVESMFIQQFGQNLSLVMRNQSRPRQVCPSIVPLVGGPRNIFVSRDRITPIASFANRNRRADDLDNPVREPYSERTWINLFRTVASPCFILVKIVLYAVDAARLVQI